MKSVKIMAIAMLALMETTSFAARIVQSKLGDIEITKTQDASEVVCTAEFYDELTIVKEAETKVLVKAAIIVFEHPDIDDDDVKMDRDFKEYLTYTMDREQTERRNGEN